MSSFTFTFSESAPRILLGSDNQQLVSAISSSLLQAGFPVETADGYHHLEPLWHRNRHEVILIEVSQPGSVESAIASALRIKQQHPHQFIAYLADANLATSGLAGDAILSRDARRLPNLLGSLLQWHKKP